MKTEETNWKDLCRETKECGCGDICMYAASRKTNPAPLGEQQGNPKYYISAGDIRPGETESIYKVGESSEEQKWTKEREMKLTKPCVFEGNPSPESWVEWLKTKFDFRGPDWDYVLFALKENASPTSEPPEEQEELWFEAFTESPVRLRHPPQKRLNTL